MISGSNGSVDIPISNRDATVRCLIVCDVPTETVINQCSINDIGLCSNIGTALLQIGEFHKHNIEYSLGSNLHVSLYSTSH